MKVGIIYQATNLKNGKIYIGQTIRGLDVRVHQHYNKSEDITNTNKFVNALRKYKKEDWKWEVLIENVPTDQLSGLERAYIWGLSAFEFGYNSTTGGEGGFIRGDETKQKMSDFRRGKPLPEQTKRKLSLMFKGRSLLEETKKKISESLMGENHPLFGKHHKEQTKKKISVANLGKTNTDEHNKKISMAKSGILQNEETKTKIANTLSKTTYKVIKPNGEIEIIKNLNKYCRDNSLCGASMYRVVGGKAKQHKGYQVQKLDIFAEIKNV
ncbi:MAG: NUMOD3 domain-containing DNA-binding protein [bacterium]|nr:NUMOD3 domain-containing DNA-binding protein [bacterium]